MRIELIDAWSGGRILDFGLHQLEVFWEKMTEATRIDEDEETYDSVERSPFPELVVSVFEPN